MYISSFLENKVPQKKKKVRCLTSSGLLSGTQSVPRFSRAVDRSHVLYRRQQAASKAGGCETSATLRAIEEQCIEETLAHLKTLTADTIAEVDDLFKDCVDSELKFYK